MTKYVESLIRSKPQTPRTPKENTLAEWEQKWKMETDLFDNETEIKRQALLNKQQKKLDEFDYHWTHVMPKKYTKYSQKLLMLQNQEATLSANGNYQRAMDLRITINSMMLEEQTLCQRNLDRDYQLFRSKFLAKQFEEFSRFDAKRREMRNQLKARQDSEFQHLFSIRSKPSYPLTSRRTAAKRKILSKPLEKRNPVLPPLQAKKENSKSKKPKVFVPKSNVNKNVIPEKTDPPSESIQTIESDIGCTISNEEEEKIHPVVKDDLPFGRAPLEGRIVAIF